MLIGDLQNVVKPSPPSPVIVRGNTELGGAADRLQIGRDLRILRIARQGCCQSLPAVGDPYLEMRVSVSPVTLHCEKSAGAEIVVEGILG